MRKLLLYYLKTILNRFYVEKTVRKNLAYVPCKTSPASSQVNDLHVNYDFV